MPEDESPKRHLALQHYDVLQNGPEEDFEHIIDLTRHLFSVPMAAMTLLDGTLHCLKSHRGFTAHAPPGVTFLTHTINSHGALIVEDTHSDPRFRNEPCISGPSGHRSFLGAPLRTPEGTRIGTIFVVDTIARGFSKFDGEIMEQLAKLVVANLELRLIAGKDSVSGAHPRRAFMDVIGRDLERYKQTGKESTLLLCRLEPKDISATAPQPVPCDAAIRKIAECIRRCMGASDTLGRLGSSCLAVLLFGVGFEEAKQAVDGFRQALEDIDLQYHRAHFGHATASSFLASGADWISEADRAAGSFGREPLEIGTTAPHPPRD